MIRWITANLGTGPSNDLGQGDLVSIDVRELVDKGGNKTTSVRQVIDSVVAQLRQGKRVVVCCDFGISRSNAVAAGALALTEKVPFDAALSRVIDATGEQEIKLELITAVRQAVEPSSTRQKIPIGARKNVLVTGANGFLGRALANRLCESHEITAPDRATLDLSAGVAGLDAFVRRHQVTDIVHLANPRSYATTEAMGQAVVMLRNVLDACRENSLRLVFLSGWEIYSGYAGERVLAAEDLRPMPQGPYGESKYLCECLLNNHQERYGLRVALLRLGPVYGPAGEKPRFIHSFIRHALANEPIVTHRYLNGDAALDLLYVDDACEILSTVIGADFCGALNIGSDSCVSTPHIAHQIARLLNSRSTISHTHIDAGVANVQMDTRRVKSMFHWTPRTSIQEGLKRVCATYTNVGRA